MHAPAVAAYAGTVLVLFLKLVCLVSIQGKTRMRTRAFRYREDAAAWNGEAVEREDEAVERAQRALDNDGETQPYFLVFGALYVAIGAASWAAFVYFPVYALARIAHTWLLLRPRQPLRTRVFGIGLLVTLALGVHVAIACVAACIAAGPDAHAG